MKEVALTASWQAKAKGLTGLGQVNVLTGVSLQTLDNWSKNKIELFEIVLRGCVRVIQEVENEHTI